MATREEPRMEVRAVAKYVRTAPRKAQLVVDLIRGRSATDATTMLRFMTRDAARDVEKVLRSAIANAEANHGLDGDELVITCAEIGSGPTLKRWRARARGRVGRIKKRTCHITIGLSVADEVEPTAPEPAEQPKPRRAARRKVETTPAQPPASAAEAPSEETPPEAPKPKRASRKTPEAAVAESPTAEAQAEVPAETKPKRAPRRKKTEDTEGSES